MAERLIYPEPPPATMTEEEYLRQENNRLHGELEDLRRRNPTDGMPRPQATPGGKAPFRDLRNR